MRIIRDKVEGDTIISENTHLYGMIIGATTIASGVRFELDGMVIGSLHLEEQSSVYLRGTVGGDVVNNGGYLLVRGVVDGRVIELGGKTDIDPRAVIGVEPA